MLRDGMSKDVCHARKHEHVTRKHCMTYPKILWSLLTSSVNFMPKVNIILFYWVVTVFLICMEDTPITSSRQRSSLFEHLPVLVDWKHDTTISAAFYFGCKSFSKLQINQLTFDTYHLIWIMMLCSYLDASDCVFLVNASQK